MLIRKLRLFGYGALFAAFGVVACLVAFLVIIAGRLVGQCDIKATTLASSVHGAILREDRVCGGMGGSDRVSLSFSREDVEKQEFLVYGPAYSFEKDLARTEPNVEWTSATSIDVSIGVVSFVGLQEERADGVVIRYRIGEVLFPDGGDR